MGTTYFSCVDRNISLSSGNTNTAMSRDQRDLKRDKRKG